MIERATTDIALLYVRPTGTLDGEPFPEIPASATEQIMARLEKLEESGGGGSGGSGTIMTGEGAPTSETAAEVGTLYMDTTSSDGDLYKCIGINEVDGALQYTWRKVAPDEVYVLGEGETIDDAPEWAKVVYDPENELGGNPTSAGWTIDGLTAETTIADDDAVPFYDTSATGQRKTLWGNIKSVLKTYFDTAYLKLSGGTLSGSLTLNGNLVMPFGNYGIRDNTDVPVFRYETINDEACLRIGHTSKRVYFYSSERPLYNGKKIALSDEIPDAYTKTEIDVIMGSYITDIDTLIGGEE